MSLLSTSTSSVFASSSRFVAAVGLASALVGCGSPVPLYGEPASSANTQTPQSLPDLAMKPEYPPGPYGNQEGEVIPQLKFGGYRLSPTERDPDKLGWDDTIDMLDYHANEACKCMLLTFGATWCGACQQEQPALVREIEGDPSFCVINILQEGPANNSVATKEDVDAWVSKFQQNYYVVQGSGATKQLWQGYGPTISLPFNMVIEPRSMVIKKTIQGFAQDIKEQAFAACGE